MFLYLLKIFWLTLDLTELTTIFFTPARLALFKALIRKRKFRADLGPNNLLVNLNSSYSLGALREVITVYQDHRVFIEAQDFFHLR